MCSMTASQTGPESQIPKPLTKGVENVDGNTFARRTAPKCKICGEHHWPFDPCPENHGSQTKKDNQQQAPEADKSGPSSLTDKFIPTCSLCGRKHWPLDPSCAGKKGARDQAKAASEAKLRAQAEKRAALEGRHRAQAERKLNAMEQEQAKIQAKLQVEANLRIEAEKQIKSYI